MCYRVAVTVDVHTTDRPRDIAYCNHWLKAAGIPGTFLIPTSMLTVRKYRHTLAALASGEHEAGTHGHFHDLSEIEALKLDGEGDIGFLARSRDCFEDFFGFPPRSFRAPCWSGLSEQSLDELCCLGYQVDSSCTPQRLGVFSSYPTENPYFWSRRTPHFINETLLEIPTSALVFPLGAPTFETFRYSGTMLFMRLLLLEARLKPDVIINFMFHVYDFSPTGRIDPAPPRSFRDLLPRTPGGFGWKRWIRETDPRNLCRTTHAMLTCLRGSDFRTLSGFYSDFLAAA
ncbi:MAG: polysaccharide deacetylase family protein [Candidatus Eisenbacteria bacterium]